MMTFSQGGPHMHTISALAVALKNAQTPEFREYQQQVGLYLEFSGLAVHEISRSLMNKLFNKN